LFSNKKKMSVTTFIYYPVPPMKIFPPKSRKIKIASCACHQTIICIQLIHVKMNSLSIKVNRNNSKWRLVTLITS